MLRELEAGAPTLDEVARRAGLDRRLVGAVVDHLVRIGRVSASSLATSCVSGGCGDCAASACGSRGTPAGAGDRPVLVALSVRRPPDRGGSR